MREVEDYTYWLDECAPELGHLIGGKALGISHLLRAGLRVPSGFVVTTAAYRRFLDDTSLASDIDRIMARARTPRNQQAASEEIKSLFEEADVNTFIAQTIEASYKRLSLGGDSTPVAVRSSATAEDTAEASFAGQQETYLWIQGAEAVLRHVKRCWASLFTPQAISYRAHLGISSTELAMGVVVQTMVPAKAAGVLITLNPVNGDPSQISIEAVYGLGEALVSGKVTPDRYSIDKVTMEIREREIVPKPVACYFEPSAGSVRLMDVPPEDQTSECISDEEARELARIGKRLEKLLGSPQDIEWAIGTNGSNPREIFLLQTRPETVWSRRKRKPIMRGDTSVMAQMANLFTSKRRKTD